MNRLFAAAATVLVSVTVGAGGRVSSAPIDISLAALPYEARVGDRATPFVVDPALAIRTCSAEGLIVLKAFAGRPQDWLDVESVIVRRGETLDRELVRTELTPLLRQQKTRPRKSDCCSYSANTPGSPWTPSIAAGGSDRVSRVFGMDLDWMASLTAPDWNQIAGFLDSMRRLRGSSGFAAWR